MLIREFIGANLDKCVVLVLVDAVQEYGLKDEWPPSALIAVKGSFD
jgi:hypothetical protein